MSVKREEEQRREDEGKTRPKVQSEEPPLFFFDVLARGRKEVLIDHNSQIYRLRVTRNGKLILNK